MFVNDFFKIAQNQFNDALPFVVYKKPNQNIVKGVFQDDNTVYTSKNLTETGFVFAPFNNEKKTILIPYDNSEIVECEFDTLINKQTALEEQNELTKAKTHHYNIVLKAIQAIDNKKFKKVVISRKEKVKLKQANALQLFQRLLQQYPTAFTYCWYHPKIGLWLGATPETLLQVKGNRFTTMALAGTQKFKNDENPKWKAKEIEEQQLVADFIINSLKASVNNLVIGKTETVKAGSLLHLKTKISGVLNSNLKTIVNALHPTPAVCGLPKEATKQFILNNENYKREFYTGFLGELNIKEKITRNTNRRNVENSAYASIKTVSNLFVNLRCMQLTDLEATIYVGGGITKDSHPDSEWEETVNKTETMKKVLF